MRPTERRVGDVTVLSLDPEDFEVPRYELAAWANERLADNFFDRARTLSDEDEARMSRRRAIAQNRTTTT